MNKIFKPLIGHPMEVYMDDIITKSKVLLEHVTNLKPIFGLLKKYQMKLNLEKFVFKMSLKNFWDLW